MKNLWILSGFRTLIMGLIVLVTDQFFKFMVWGYFTALEIKRIDIIDNWFSIRLVENDGIAFGISFPPVIIVIVVIVLLLLGLRLANAHLDMKLTINHLLVGGVLGGAVGNLIDRIRLGHVIDFISVREFPVFNFADIFITVGIFSIILFYGKLSQNNKHSK